ICKGQSPSDIKVETRTKSKKLRRTPSRLLSGFRGINLFLLSIKQDLDEDSKNWSKND
ncbi:14851_t:CDS:2, partial [Acaulospora morrowiae]